MTDDIQPRTPGNRLFFYGAPKIGLTKFAQEFTNPQFVCFNNPHLSQLKVKSQNIETMDEFKIWIKEAKSNKESTTYIFDNFDGFQDIIAADICLKSNVPNINCREFQSGFFDAICLFKKILTMLDKISLKGHNFVFLGHSTHIPYKTNENSDIIRHVPSSYIKNHKGEDIVNILCNWVDGIFFVDLNNKSIVCYPFVSPYFLAGTRFENLKEIMTLDAKSIEYSINYSKGFIKI